MCNTAVTFLEQLNNGKIKRSYTENSREYRRYYRADITYKNLPNRVNDDDQVIVGCGCCCMVGNVFVEVDKKEIIGRTKGSLTKYTLFIIVGKD